LFTVRLLSLLLTFTCLAHLLAIEHSFAQEAVLTSEEKAWITEHPIIKSAGGTTSPPVEFSVDGIENGFSIDYLKLAAQKVGLKVEFQNYDEWNDQIDAIKSRQIDVMHSISYTEERSVYLDFTDKYIETPLVYFGKTDAEPISNIEDLYGKRIGVINGWAAVNAYRRDYPNLNLINQLGSKEGLISLSAGEIDVFIVQLPMANYLITQNFIAGLKVIGSRFIHDEIVSDMMQLGTRNDWPLLNSILQKGQDAITDREYITLSLINGFQNMTILTMLL
jgi:ABC-type amino acid transport substrate-binding protein